MALVLLVENCRDAEASADTDFALAALRDIAGRELAALAAATMATPAPTTAAI